MTDHIKNIGLIFAALDVGLDCVTGDPTGPKSVDFTPPEDSTINPELFNRGNVVIDGVTYTVSVFQPHQPEDQS